MRRSCWKPLARVVLDGARGSLSTQLDRIEWVRSQPEPLAPAQPPGHWSDEPVCLPQGLQFDNGLGGFSADGREYCVLIRASIPYSGLSAQNGQPGRTTNPKPILPPAPWINVVANPAVGFLISEGGAGYTWAGNSQTNRLTGWSNDPVIDPPSEVVYLRDEQTGETWCPTPLPIPAEAPVLVRHGQGYTVFASNAHGLEHELTLSVPQRRSGQARPVTDPQRDDPSAATVGDLLCRMGAGDDAGCQCDARRHRARS